jgi:hypothetical protein
MAPNRLPQCAQTLKNGLRCRRIPKHGQSLCPSHSTPHRRRPFEENEAFQRHISRFSDHLRFMPLDDLLRDACAMLQAVHPLIDLRSRRRDRLTFSRASATVNIAATRLQQSFLEYSREQAAAPSPTQPRPPQPKSTPATPVHALQLEPSPATPNPLTKQQQQQIQNLLTTSHQSASPTTYTQNSRLKTDTPNSQLTTESHNSQLNPASIQR